MLQEWDLKVLNTGLEIVETADSKGIVLRLLGALAVYLHCREYHGLDEVLSKIGRLEGGKTFTDVDIIAYSKHRKHIIELMKEMKLNGDMMINALFGHKRLIYYKGDVRVDVFFDKLEFSHDIYFGKDPGKGRLELDYPTITLADLVLEKLQIHQINRKDLVDLLLLFMAHPVSDFEERKTINGKYIAGVLSEDWGFWLDATTNLKKVISFAEKCVMEGKISTGDFKNVELRVAKLLDMIDNIPKSKSWRERSRVGTSKPWYREVDEVNI